MTIGIVALARCAASAALIVVTTTKAGLRCATSMASVGKRLRANTRLAERLLSPHTKIYKIYQKLCELAHTLFARTHPHY